jgi:hypothetical protein
MAVMADPEITYYKTFKQIAAWWLITATGQYAVDVVLGKVRRLRRSQIMRKKRAE